MSDTEWKFLFERMPSGNVVRYVSPVLSERADRPATLICDCCVRPADRLWVYRQRGFCVLQFPCVFNSGCWSFCVYCNALFERRDMAALRARVMTLNPDLSSVAIDAVYELLPWVIYGDPYKWQSGGGMKAINRMASYEAEKISGEAGT